MRCKREAFQATLYEIGKKNPRAKPEQFYDNSLVQELIKRASSLPYGGDNPRLFRSTSKMTEREEQIACL